MRRRSDVRRVYDRDWPSTLREALEDETVDTLKQLAAFFDETPAGTRKAHLVDFLIGQLEGPKLRDVWSRLDAAQQAAVAETVYSDVPAFSPKFFAAKHGTAPDFGTYEKRMWGWYRTTPSLLCLFLLGEYRVLPSDLATRLEAFVPEPAQASLKTSDEPPARFSKPAVKFVVEGEAETRREALDVPVEVRETERAALADLVAVLRLVDTGKLNATDRGKLPTVGALKAIESVLRDGEYYAQPAEKLRKNRPKAFATPSEYAAWERESEDEIGAIRAFAWPVILMAAGLVEAREKKLGLTKAGREALSRKPAEVIRDCWRAWLDTKFFDEFSRVDAVKGQGKDGGRAMTRSAPRRAAVAHTLAECPIGAWVRVDAFWRYLIAAGNDFEVVKTAWSLYLVDPTYGGLGYDGAPSWSILQGRFVLVFLFEYAATLGLIDVAYVSPSYAMHDFRDRWGSSNLEFLSRYDGLVAFRRTPLGAYCMGETDTYAPAIAEAPRSLRVLPNLEVVRTSVEASAGDAIFLETFAEKASDVVWRLDRAKMLAAAEAGFDVAELGTFLEAHSGEPLPQTVSRLLADAEDRANRVRYSSEARLYECADAETAMLVAHDSRTRKLCLLAGERHLAVPATSDAAFRRALKQLGYCVRPVARW
jgi:hypothetical protein